MKYKTLAQNVVKLLEKKTLTADLRNTKAFKTLGNEFFIGNRLSFSAFSVFFWVFGTYHKGTHNSGTVPINVFICSLKSLIFYGESASNSHRKIKKVTKIFPIRAKSSLL